MSHCLARQKSCLSVGSLTKFMRILAISCDRSSLNLLRPRGSGLARSPAVHSLQTVLCSRTCTPPTPQGTIRLRKPRRLVFLRNTSLTMLLFPWVNLFIRRWIRTHPGPSVYQLITGCYSDVLLKC